MAPSILAQGRTKDTTVLVNSPPEISDLSFNDILGEHSFEVRAQVKDVDDQLISCILTTGSGTQEMPIENGFAGATVTGTPLSPMNVNVTCSDGMLTDEVSGTHLVPNYLPSLKNIPDISLLPNNISSIDLGYLSRDEDGDNMLFDMVDNIDPAAADVSIENDILTVRANGNVNSSRVCIRVSDYYRDGNTACTNISIENPDESRLKNNEVKNTSITLLQKIQYFNGTDFEDEFNKTDMLTVLPGSKNEIPLSGIFEWNSATSSRKQGLFRVLFEAVDGQGKVLYNRDGSPILSYYNFTLLFVNTPPNITGIPEKKIFENETPH